MNDDVTDGALHGVSVRSGRSLPRLFSLFGYNEQYNATGC